MTFIVRLSKGNIIKTKELLEGNGYMVMQQTDDIETDGMVFDIN